MTNIKTKIHTIRGQQVMLDRDLAELYGVNTSYLNKAVKRNINRFIPNYMFKLTTKEYDSLTFQIGITKKGRGGRRHLPYAFTEHGTLMLSSILNSETAINTNKVIINTFIEIRKLATTHPQYDLLREKVKRIESDIKVINTNQIVEQNQSNTKLTQLSKEVMRLTEVLDHFQNTHAIIKRPNEKEQKG